jgi:hypothetical protein
MPKKFFSFILGKIWFIFNTPFTILLSLPISQHPRRKQWKPFLAMEIIPKCKIKSLNFVERINKYPWPWKIVCLFVHRQQQIDDGRWREIWATCIFLFSHIGKFLVIEHTKVNYVFVAIILTDNKVSWLNGLTKVTIERIMNNFVWGNDIWQQYSFVHKAVNQ